MHPGVDTATFTVHYWIFFVRGGGYFQEFKSKIKVLYEKFQFLGGEGILLGPQIEGPIRGWAFMGPQVPRGAPILGGGEAFPKSNLIRSLPPQHHHHHVPLQLFCKEMIDIVSVDQ